MFVEYCACQVKRVLFQCVYLWGTGCDETASNSYRGANRTYTYLATLNFIRI